MEKRTVKIVANMPIYGVTSGVLLGTIRKVDFTTEQIRKCIVQKGIVDEYNDDGTMKRLHLSNYDEVVKDDTSKEDEIVEDDTSKEDEIVEDDTSKEDEIVEDDTSKEDEIVEDDTSKEDEVEETNGIGNTEDAIDIEPDKIEVETVKKNGSIKKKK